MIVVVVEADLTVGDDLLIPRQLAKVIVPAIEDMFHFMGMDADGGIDGRVLLRQCNGRTASRQIAADGYEGFDTGFSGAGNHRLAILILTGIVQMGMRIEKHGGLSVGG